MTTPSPANLAQMKAPPVLRHRRGEIWMVTSDPGSPAIGTEIWSDRPAIIVSNNVMNARGGFAQVVYLSSSTRKQSGPTHVRIPSTDGVGTVMALCEQVHTVDASRLRHRMGAVPQEYIRDIDAALSLSLSIGRNPDTHSTFRKWEEHIKQHGIDIEREINALAGLTVDQRVIALTRALELTAIEKDSYRNLYEAAGEQPSAMAAVADALSHGPHPPAS